MDGRADDAPAFPDADPGFDADPGHDYNTSYLPPNDRLDRRKNLTKVANAPGAMSKASMAAPKRRAPRDRRTSLTANQREQLRYRQQVFDFRAATDDMV